MRWLATPERGRRRPGSPLGAHPSQILNREWPGEQQSQRTLPAATWIEPVTVHYTLVRGPRDVEQILALQAENHRDTVDEATARQEGFTSVRHDPAVLQAMNRAYPTVCDARNEVSTRSS